MLPVDPVGWRMRKSSPSQAKPYGDISIARGDEWKARFLYRSVVSFGFVNFVIFKNNELYLVVPASVCHLVYFHLYRTCRNGATSLSEGLSLKPGTTSLSSWMVVAAVDGDVMWRDVTWRDVMWCVIKLDLMPLTFLGLAIVVANLKLLGQIAICSMYLNVLRREARATSDWRPRPWNIQIQMESAVAEFSTSFAKLQLFVSFCQACSSFSTTL